ncbi:K02A2.6-like [Cordylochernes scorpioides]|uniref:RNA-directed DNA polymerase n=1 Tax=Cordylochernes scorpioides TaxID=51811 RepID=A0ABY6KEI9_9ARAC|nr:K02A2.6-like [Cordylochernes scorpioides]
MPGHRKRRQFKQTDAFTRGMVIGLKRAGCAPTVEKVVEQGNVAIYRNVGATRVTSARVDRRILRQAVAAPKATCTAILQHVQDTLDHSISTRTISRRLVANGLHSCRPLRRLPLTPPNRRQRLEWCRARSTWMTEWHRVVFSDESRFCLSSDSRRVRVWRRRGERSNPAAIVERPTVRKRGIMVWGAIAYDSRSPLLRIQGTMTAQRYVDGVLRPVTLPYLQGMLPWPPYSPDLSPIEHVWDIIGRRLHALPQPRSEDELWQMVEREWRAIPQDAIRTLIDSLPRRVAACIAVRVSGGESGLRLWKEPDSCHLVCMPVETRGQKMASEELLKQFMGLMRQEREQEKEEEERRREQEREEKLKRREEKEEKLKREKEEEERRREQEKEEKLKRREEKKEKWAKVLSGIGINVALESEVDERRGEFKRLEDELARLKSNGGFVAGTASAVLKITPPTFDGQSSFGNYMRQFEAVSLNNGWGEAERAINLIVPLRGPALDLLQTIPEQDQRSYVSLVSALELRFGDQHSRHVFQSQLKLRRQKLGESLQEFEADLKRLCLMAYPSAPIDFIDQWVAQTFIEGIRNVEVQKTLRLTSFNTLREALIRALEIDAAFKISDSGPPRVRKSELTEEDGAVGGSRDSGIEEIIKRLDKLEEAVKHRRRPVGPCFRCGKMGHLKSQCTSRLSTEQQQQYHFQIRHRPGKRHHNADALSRRPCGSCKHCEKIDKNESEATSRGTTVVPSDEWTPASCRATQQQDLNIGPILELKENGNLRPSWEIISDKSPALKALWAQWDSLRLVVPEVKIPCVLREVHSGASGSHFGVTKTLRKVRERFYWVYCREDVENWCRRCTTCAASKGPQTRSRGKMREYKVGAPFERIAIDVAGPFPVTEDGNKYLLVAMDYFTKWPEVYAIPNQEAATVARVLVDNLICRFGVPLELHSDQGRNFESEIFRELCQVLGIWKTRTTPLHPQSDGMVERFNKTMVEHLSRVVEQNQRDWDRRLPLFLMAYRAAIHETTGQTPAKVMFGRELRLPCDLEFGTPGGPPVEVTSYVGELRGVLSETHKLVRKKIQLASHRMKTHYDLKANHEGFKENDLVWMFNPKRKRGLSPKLTPMWEGPYKVVKRINDLVYRIQRSSKAKPRVVHLSRLALFQGEQSEWT